MPAEAVARGIAEALLQFLQHFEHSTLHDIYFVDIVPSVVLLIQQNMEQLCVLSKEPQYCGMVSNVKSITFWLIPHTESATF